MTDTSVLQFAQERTILTDEEFNILEDWHAIVDAAADEIDEQLESFDIKETHHHVRHHRSVDGAQADREFKVVAHYGFAPSTGFRRPWSRSRRSVALGI